MTDIQICEAGVNAIGEDAAVELIVEATVKLDGLIARAKELRAELDRRVVARIKASGEFSIGDVRYYVATPKTVKCRDQGAATRTLLEVTGGDLERFVGCLASGAFKHGHVRKLLDELAAPPETFDLLFSTEFNDELKEGKLTKADKRFAA